MWGPTRGMLAVIVVLVALCAATIVPVGAASSWSPPVQLPGSCGGSAVAVNAAGAMVAGGTFRAADGTSQIEVCTSPDGSRWSLVTLGPGGDEPHTGHHPAVALAPDGRAVAVWGGITGCPALCTYIVQASVRAPGGAWSTPTTISTNLAFGHGDVVIGMDGSGNALAAWIGGDGDGVDSAFLPAGGSWTSRAPIHTMWEHNPDLAVTPSGHLILTWAGTEDAIWAVSGTVLGGFDVPVSVAPPAYHKTAQPRIALNEAGQAAVSWSLHTSAANSSNTRVSARSSDGTWSAPMVIAPLPYATSSAIDGAGNAIAIFGPSYSWHLAGGGWGPATALPAGSTGGLVVADAAGTFVYADTSGNVFTFTAGASFGSPVTVCPTGGASDLRIAPGHAVVLCGGAVSSEPVS